MSTAGDPSKAIVRAVSALGTDAPSQDLPYLVQLASGFGVKAPYQCTITPLAKPSLPTPSLDAQVAEFWTAEANIPAKTLLALGIAGTTLEDFGVAGFSPPMGQATTILEAIDAAVLAAVAVLGPAVFNDQTLMLAVGTLFLAWTVAGGPALAGGAGGVLQTLGLNLG